MDQPSASLFLAAGSGLAHATAYVLYNRQMSHDESRPNPVAWTIWAAIAVLNCWTYFSINGDWVKVILPSVSSLACFFTFSRVLCRGQLRWPKGTDALALGVGLAAVAVWYWYRAAAFANIVLQLARVISYLVVIKTLLADVTAEHPAPWFVWSFAYVLMFGVLALRWGGNWAELAYPTVGLTMNGIVGVMAHRRCRAFEPRR